MVKLVISSLRKDAGKTAMALGIANESKMKIGYMKPLGDRLLYRKKRLWDFDSAIFTNLFTIDELPEDMSIGFDHSKLRYMYDADSCQKRLLEMAESTGRGKELLLVETSQDLTRGISVHLDTFSICRAIEGRLLVVANGNNDEIVDDLVFMKQRLNLEGINLAGVIINKVTDLEEFNSVHMNYLQELDLNILGVMPFERELTFPTVKFIADILFARVLTGNESLGRIVKEIFVGAMSADAVLRMEKFTKTGKLIITGGDRSDMLLAAIDTDCVAVVLTNNVLPPPNIIAMAAEKNVPLLLTQGDTYETAKKIDQMVPLLSHTDTDKIEKIKSTFSENINGEALAKLLR